MSEVFTSLVVVAVQRSDTDLGFLPGAFGEVEASVGHGVLQDALVHSLLKSREWREKCFKRRLIVCMFNSTSIKAIHRFKNKEWSKLT